jgi:hypothetical protein
MAVNMMSDRNP